jgi:hypothetical protein
VNAGDKGAKGKEKKNRKSGRIGVQHSLNVRDEQEIHGRQESSPVKSLRPDEPDAIGSALGVPPTPNDTQDPRENGEYLPIKDERLLVDARVSHANKGENQNEQIGQKTEKTRMPSLLIDVSMVGR